MRDANVVGKGCSSRLVQRNGWTGSNADHLFARTHRGTAEITTGKSGDDIAALADKFGCLMVGPPLREDIFTIGLSRS
jgi:hypothetical protein